MRDEALWRRIEAHPMRLLDGTPLERRLLRLGLGARRTRAVVAEYRRFLYLAAVSGPEVTPPLILRHAWRVHARDHASYSRELVGAVIGRPMPEPFDAPLSEADAAHRRTRALYREEFGAHPPPAIWPGAGAVLAGRVLRVAVPGALMLGVYLLVTRAVPWGLVALVTGLALFALRERVAPWAFRRRDRSSDLDFDGPGQGDDGLDLLDNGD